MSSWPSIVRFKRFLSPLQHKVKENQRRHQLGRRLRATREKSLIIDTDMRRPTVHLYVPCSEWSWTFESVNASSGKEKAILPTKVDNLSILTAGPIPPNPAELLSSRAMEHLTEQLREEFDIIIFDAPPLLQVADSRITSKLTDGVVLVVGCTTSDRQRC